MDTAVGLVTAYLQLNGYFVQTEVPVVRRIGEEPPRFEQATDIDVLAVRFPSRVHQRPPVESEHWAGIVAVDASLGAPADEMDVIIGEVKEGPTRLNPNLTSREVLECALYHTGGCLPEDIRDLTGRLIDTGEATATHCHGGRQVIRLVAFGGTDPEEARSYKVVTLEQILAFLRRTTRDNDAVFRVIDSKDPVLSLILLMNQFEV